MIKFCGNCQYFQSISINDFYSEENCLHPQAEDNQIYLTRFFIIT